MFIFSIEFIIGLIIGLITGFVLGAISKHLGAKNNIKYSQFLGSVLFIVWVLMHIYGFIYDKQIAFIFDIIGGVATGMMLGIKVNEDTILHLMTILKQGIKK